MANLLQQLSLSITAQRKLYHNEHWKPLKVLIDSQLTSPCLLVFPILAQSESTLVQEEEKSKCTVTVLFVSLRLN